MLSRRFRRWKISNEQAEKPGGKTDSAFGFLPDLLIVDGGKGQLGKAYQVLEEYGLEEKVPVVGLTKGNEELYRVGKRDPIILPRRSDGLYLVQRIRDEAHRFALKQHRSQRRRIGLASQLDNIPGIGPQRRKALIRVFGDLEGIRKAKVDDLMAIPGINRGLAERVKGEL